MPKKKRSAEVAVSLIGSSCLEVEVRNISILKTERSPVIAFPIDRYLSPRTPSCAQRSPARAGSFAAQFAPFSANVRSVLRPKTAMHDLFQGARKHGVANLAIPARDVLVNNYVESIS